MHRTISKDAALALADGITRFLKEVRAVPGCAALRAEHGLTRLVPLPNRDEELHHLAVKRDDAGLRRPLGRRGLVPPQDDDRALQVDVRPLEPARLAGPLPGDPEEPDELDEPLAGGRLLLRLPALRRREELLELLVGHRAAGFAGPVIHAPERVRGDEPLLAAQLKGRWTVATTCALVRSLFHSGCLSSQDVRWNGRQSLSLTFRQPWGLGERLEGIFRS
jgi:hypothetical protein